jgi:hypothetical protein
MKIFFKETPYKKIIYQLFQTKKPQKGAPTKK